MYVLAGEPPMEKMVISGCHVITTINVVLLPPRAIQPSKTL